MAAVPKILIFASLLCSTALSQEESPEQLWALLTSPETSYSQRLAAAKRGKDVLPLEWLPRLLEAQDLLHKENELHFWGLDYPKLFHIVHRIKPPFGSTRVIFGTTWQVPDNRTKYPETPEEEAAAPWPWQVQRALEDLYLGMARDADPRRWIEVVSAMPCRTDEQAKRLWGAARFFRNFEILGAIRNITLNPKFPMAAEYAVDSTLRGLHPLTP